MTGAARRKRALIATVCGMALALGAWRQAGASPPIVDLLAARGSRLADDLRRELGTSGFLVVVVESTTADWRADVLQLAGHPPIHGVVVRADERLMTVFTRTATANTVEAQLELTVDPRDRLARRRACLGVVEYLRVLSENDPPAPFDLSPTASAKPGSLPPVPASPAGAAVVTPSASPGARNPAPAAGGAAQTSAVPSSAVSSARKDMDVAGPAAASQTASSPVGEPAVKDGVPSSIPVSAGVGAPAGEIPVRHRPWEVGAGSTLDLQASPGGPTVHLQFLWYLPLEWNLAICVRALWPVLGAEFKTGGEDIRVWNFGGAGSLQYVFASGAPRLRPFIGAAVGTRVALTETTAVDALQSSETFTPSATLGAETGIRYALSPPVQLFLEVGLVHAWMFPGVHRAPYEQQAANSDSFHASFGVLFEI